MRHLRQASVTERARCSIMLNLPSGQGQHMNFFKRLTSLFHRTSVEAPRDNRRQTSIACHDIETEEDLIRVINAAVAETRRQDALQSKEDQR